MSESSFASISILYIAFSSRVSPTFGPADGTRGKSDVGVFASASKQKIKHAARNYRVIIGKAIRRPRTMKTADTDQLFSPGLYSRFVYSTSSMLECFRLSDIKREREKTNKEKKNK